MALMRTYIASMFRPSASARQGTVRHGSGEIGNSVSCPELMCSAVSRRALLQSIPAIALALNSTQNTLASADSESKSSRITRHVQIDRKYMLFPINNEALSRRVRLATRGRVVRSFTASLGLPAQWWAHLDVSEWQKQVLTLSIEPDNSPDIAEMGIVLGRGQNETGDADLVEAVRTSGDIWSPETLYKEPLRPTFHFTAKRGWNNDPNGLVYHRGQYHLFFQHNPYGVRWGNMHWGHAVSPDLVHWRELPIALYPRGDDDLPFSGSGVVDQGNTSGWGRNGQPPMVVAFTSTGRGECIAYSQDDGLTWHEFDGNPVIKHDGRDPRLIWHSPTSNWVMVVYSERPGSDEAKPKRQGFAFYTSPDLKSWKERSWIEGYIECPDLFALPVDGDPKRVMWVLSCGAGYYCLGQFDGSCFTPESTRLPAPSGGESNAKGILAAPLPLIYAGQTFSNHPEGSVVQIAWARVDTTDAPFTQMMNFPTTLSLRTTTEGVRLCREPVDAIRSLRTQSHDVPPGPLTPTPLLVALDGDAWDIEAVIRIGTISPVLLKIGADEYLYHPASQMLIGPTGAIPIPLTKRRLTLRILVDRTTVEIFGDCGQAYGMFIRSSSSGNTALELRTWKLIKDELYVEKMSVHLLRPAWQS